MKITKQIKAELLRDIVKLPEEITGDTLLEVTVQDIPVQGTEVREGHRRGSRELKEMFESRIRAASSELNFTEEVFTLDEVQWQDLNEVKTYFEGQGYGVKVEQEGGKVRFKILWRYV